MSVEDIIWKLFEDADHGTSQETVEKIWNSALELAAKEVNKIGLDHNTVVCAVDVINRNRTDR